MNTEKDCCPLREQAGPPDLLAQFVGIFQERGLLDRCIRIRHRDRGYWISCSTTTFVAYRMNDHGHLSPGIPGWPVCIVKTDKIINDSDMCSFASAEPSVHEWYQCIVNNDFEML